MRQAVRALAIRTGLTLVDQTKLSQPPVNSPGIRSITEAEERHAGTRDERLTAGRPADIRRSRPGHRRHRSRAEGRLYHGRRVWDSGSAARSGFPASSTFSRSPVRVRKSLSSAGRPDCIFCANLPISRAESGGGGPTDRHAICAALGFDEDAVRRSRCSCHRSWRTISSTTRKHGELLLSTFGNVWICYPSISGPGMNVDACHRTVSRPRAPPAPGLERFGACSTGSTAYSTSSGDHLVRRIRAW